MSYHDGLAVKAAEMGHTAARFRIAAQQHANATWIYAIVGGIVWYFAAWKWALIPFGLAAYVAYQSVSCTLIAERLQRLEQLRGAGG